MNGFWAVYKRELKGYFATPVAYVFLVIFLFIAGWWTFRDGFYEFRQADMTIFFRTLPWFLAFMGPAAAMRLWAEERKTGSIELLFTLPITVSQAVIGKFLAAWTFLAIALVLTFPIPVTVAYLGDPDAGLIIAGYVGSLLVAGMFLAIGSFFSALSKNQVISVILACVTCLALMLAGLPTTLNYLSAALPAGLLGVAESLFVQTQFESMVKGMVAFSNIAYFLILITGWVAACSVILNERKAS
ncbi:MAG: ABC transporter permease subunit [Phycisphaerae bacterium]|nr:ABC transporter permease subunit [Phycisphaerae bacterium]